MNLKMQIYELISRDEYLPLGASCIQEQLGLTEAKDFTLVMKALNELEDEYLIGHTSKGKYDLLKRLRRFVGKIDLKEAGFGFVITEELDKDIFIPKKMSLDALNRDLVLVELTSSLDEAEGRVIEVIKRNTEYMVGTLKQKGKEYIVYPENFKLGIIAKVKKEDLNGAKVNDKVKVYLTRYQSDGKCSGEIVSVIGKKTDPGIDITMLVEESALRNVFPQEVLDYANKVPQTINFKDYPHYRNLEDELIFTIDGDDARDFDDAVGIKVLDNGNYELGVYIADVTSYVKPNDLLDLEAQERLFSIYLPDRVIPMLPFALSNGICSLNPNEARLTLACVMEIDGKGDLVSCDIFEAIIKSKMRFTYSFVNKILDGEKSALEKTDYKLVESLEKMRKLAQILAKNRYERGSLDFETREAKIILDEQGNTKDVKVIERGISENIIEEFMIKANEAVTEAMEYQLLPFIYRVHEEPVMEKLEVFNNIARRLGYKLNLKKGEVHPRALQQILEDAKDELQGTIINNLLLRSMAKAKYHDTNLGHYGLASKHYTHFTSPIRRYPDLLVHRLIKDLYLKQKGLNNPQILSDYAKIISDVSKASSDKERQIERLERDTVDMKKCEYMKHYLDIPFKGIISSVTKWGFYVELENTVEGLVSKENMGINKYFFDEDLLCWHDKKYNKVYQIGDIVEVIAISSSKERREIDFIIKENSYGYKK
ncbi:MAG: ribonuclease R [Bacilli bacterium]|nr:ribonuclease R [Bacilli bacterium]